MFSEALKILDRNTVNYMIDELQKELAEKSAALEEKDTAIIAMSKEKELVTAENAQLKKQLEQALAAAANVKPEERERSI